MTHSETFKECELAVINNLRNHDKYSNSMGLQNENENKRKPFYSQTRSVSTSEVTKRLATGNRNLERRHEKEKLEDIMQIVGPRNLSKFLSLIKKSQ